MRGGDKRPQLSDLRESGAIEHDADMAIFLYRPEYHGISMCETGESTEGLTELIIAKNRNDRTGKSQLHFDANLTKFRDIDPDDQNFVYQKNNTPF